MYELAEVFRSQQDVDGARDYFTRAHAAFAEIGAVPDMRRIQTELESLN